MSKASAKPQRENSTGCMRMRRVSPWKPSLWYWACSSATTIGQPPTSPSRQPSDWLEVHPGVRRQRVFVSAATGQGLGSRLMLSIMDVARSKGLAERVVVMKHVVRNALIPVVTLVALQMPAVFGGAIVTEQIFRIPGIGSLLIDAILRNDTPVIMAVTFVFSCLVILFNLIADLLYGWLDPRISYR